eukprot:1594650-Rhodomonas_salina.1
MRVCKTRGRECASRFTQHPKSASQSLLPRLVLSPSSLSPRASFPSSSFILFSRSRARGRFQRYPSPPSVLSPVAPYRTSVPHCASHLTPYASLEPLPSVLAHVAR